MVPDLGQIKVRGNLDYENGPRVNKIIDPHIFCVNIKQLTFTYFDRGRMTRSELESKIQNMRFIKFDFMIKLKFPLQEYRLTYRVFDDKFANTATVVIKVTDVNDNPPRFDPSEYIVEDVVEEDQFVSESNPKFLIRVSLIQANYKIVITVV